MLINITIYVVWTNTFDSAKVEKLYFQRSFSEFIKFITASLNVFVSFGNVIQLRCFVQSHRILQREEKSSQ